MPPYAPLTQVYLAYLIHLRARSWLNLKPLQAIALGNGGDSLSIHHVFPKKFLARRDFPRKRINCMSNYAILSHADNTELGDRDPSSAHKRLTRMQREAAAQQLFFLADDDRWLNIEAYEEFRHMRATRIADGINNFLELP